MKKYLLFAVLIIMAGCDIYIVDEPYVVYDDRDMFVGNYHINEFSQTTEQSYNYNVHILKSCCDTQEIRITNFYGSELEVYALVNDNRLTIPLQRVDGYEIEGTGKMDYDKLVFTFVVRDLYAYPVFTDFVDAEGWMY